MWGGWFGGGLAEPSNYENVAMPLWLNVRAFVLGSIFLIPFLAFLVVLPGVREKRLITLLTVTIVTVTGASLSACLCFPAWSVGAAHIVAQFRAHTAERVFATIGVNIGLNSLNVTLKFDQMMFAGNALWTPVDEIDMTRLYFNERFDLSSVNSMSAELEEAYVRGLPYPLLSVLEHLSLNSDAFDWGRHYRTAGHYTYAAMWCSWAFWALSLLLLLFLPHQYYKGSLACGAMALTAALVYQLTSPTDLRISFVGRDGRRTLLEMHAGWCHYLTVAVGALGVCFGLVLLLLHLSHVYSLSTFLDSTLDETVIPKCKRRWGGGRTSSSLSSDAAASTLSSSVDSTQFASSIDMMRRQRPIAFALPGDPKSPSVHNAPAGIIELSAAPKSRPLKAAKIAAAENCAEKPAKPGATSRSSGFESRASCAPSSGSFRSSSASSLFAESPGLHRVLSNLTLTTKPPTDDVLKNEQNQASEATEAATAAADEDVENRRHVVVLELSGCSDAPAFQPIATQPQPIPPAPS